MIRTEALLAAGLLALAGLALGCNGKSSSGEPTMTVTDTVTVTERSSSEPAETMTVSEPKVEVAKIGRGAPTRRVEFGHIRSLKRTEGGYFLRFDPAEYLTGVTASDAMQEDTGSSEVANDNYVVDEGHRLFTYTVPADATRDGSGRRRRGDADHGRRAREDRQGRPAARPSPLRAARDGRLDPLRGGHRPLDRPAVRAVRRGRRASTSGVTGPG